MESARITAASARTHFPGQKADQSQFGPLAGAEGLRKLLPGVLKGGSNRVHGGNRQNAPRVGLTASYCEA